MGKLEGSVDVLALAWCWHQLGALSQLLSPEPVQVTPGLSLDLDPSIA